MSNPSRVSRTPSGLDVEGKIKSLRTIFSPNNEGYVHDQTNLASLISSKSLDLNTNVTDNRPTGVQSTVKSVSLTSLKSPDLNTVNFPSVTDNQLIGERPTVKLHSPILQRGNFLEQNKLTKSRERLLTQADQSDIESDLFHTPPSTPKQGLKKRIKGPKDFIMSEKGKMSLSNEEEIQGTEESPISQLEKMMAGYDEEVDGTQMIDIKLVHTMFKRLEISIEQKIKKYLPAQSVELNTDREVGKGTRKDDKDCASQKTKNKVMVSTIQRSWEEKQELKERIEKLESSNANKMIILTGLHTSEKKNEALPQIDHFFKTKLKMNPLIEDYYEIGSAYPRAKVVIFNSLREKKIAMSRKKELKGQKNEDGNPFYLNDYLLPHKLEKIKGEKFLIRMNDSRGENDRAKIEKKDGVLTINNEEYTTPIEVPCVQQILDMTPEELDEVLALPICKGPQLESEGNLFIGFSLAVNSLDSISKAYLKMKICYPKARHIMCAYMLQGEEYHMTRGSCDDGEHGAGNRMLQMLIDNNMEARVVFVVRFYSGKKIGPSRFDCILQAQKNCLELYPVNSLLGHSQEFDSQEEEETNYSSQEDTEEEHEKDMKMDTSSSQQWLNPRQKRTGESPQNQPPTKIHTQSNKGRGGRGGKRNQRGGGRGGKSRPFRSK